jgi:SAM-dependent methyltransferase
MDRQVYDRMRELELSHWWFKARRRILASEIARLGLPEKAQILEVGCGSGGNLEMLSRFGEVGGIEPDDYSRQYVRLSKGIEVLDGHLPDGLPALRRPLDLIAAFDVIEHVDDDAGAVRALASRLKPGGILITTVPAHPWMWSAHDEQHHHKRRYRASEYRALFDVPGLRLRRMTYFNTILFPPIAGIRLLKHWMKVRSSDDGRNLPGWLNRTLESIFGFERNLLARTDLPFGVSILLIAEAVV